MKITSKSQLKKNKKFSLNLFKTPFCYKEKKNLDIMKCHLLSRNILKIKKFSMN